MKKTKTITRRGAILGAAIGASAMLSGCSIEVPSAPTPVQPGISSSLMSSSAAFDYEHAYLPLGSVVQLQGFSDHVEFMIIARRPQVDSEDGSVPAYIGTFWPFGATAFTQERVNSGNSEFVPFNTEHITQVLFVGYNDALEKEASAELELGRGTNKNCLELMMPLMDSYFNVEEIIALAEDEEG